MTSAPTTPASGVRWEPAAGRPGFAEAARPHLAGLYSLARCLAGDPDIAEDLVRRCLLRAHRDDGDLTDVETLPVRLRQMLVVCCRDHWRAHAPERPEPSRDSRTGRRAPAEPGGGGSAVAFRLLAAGRVSTMEMDDVWEVLERLETIHRVPLVLVQMEGCTIAEVADLLDLPHGTVRSRLHEGRRQFQRQLWDHALEQGLLPRDLGDGAFEHVVSSGAGSGPRGRSRPSGHR